jgi:biopolymer transport protein ExbB
MLEFVNTLAKGGIVMVPLAICSLASLTVLLERIKVLRGAAGDSGPLLKQLRASICRRDFSTALEAAESGKGPAAEVLAEGLRAFLAGADPKEAMEEATLEQLPRLQRRLIVLDTVVTIAPLLGLFGTVIGMISSFHILAIAGTEHPTGITAGIAEALIATATGLVIAIFSLVGFNWCQERVRNILAEIDRRSSQLGNLLARAAVKEKKEQEDEVALSSV